MGPNHYYNYESPTLRVFLFTFWFRAVLIGYLKTKRVQVYYALGKDLHKLIIFMKIVYNSSKGVDIHEF